MVFGKPRNQKRKLRREDTSRCVEKELASKALLFYEISSCLHPPPGPSSTGTEEAGSGLLQNSPESETDPEEKAAKEGGAASKGKNTKNPRPQTETKCIF